jgi:O-antigen ligase
MFFIKSNFYIYLILLFTIPILPSFKVIDPMGAQWFYLAILNVIFLFISSYSSLPSLNFPFKLYLLFFSFGVISIIFSNNLILSVIDLSRLSLIIISGFILLKLYHNDKLFISLDSIILIIITFLFIEVIYSLWPFFYSIFLELFTTSRLPLNVNFFTGLAGNKNITAASIVIKLPFVFYFIIKGKHSFYSYLILLLSSLSIIFLLSRASYISFFLLLLGIFFFLIKYKHFKKFLITSFLLAISYVLSQVPQNLSSNVANQIKSIGFNESSSNWRFELWRNAFDNISESPFLGVGIGNWKIESLPYWKFNLEDYIVPYHAHNDFIQYIAELGIIGGLSFIFFFISLIYFFAKRTYNSKSFLNSNPIYFLLLLVVFSLGIDNFFNFPHERFIIQINTILILFFTNILKDEIQL